MNALVKVTVPVALAKRLEDQLDRMQDLHQKEVEDFERRAKVLTDPKEINALQHDLRERAKRLTSQHLLRLCIEAGARVLEKEPAALLRAVEKDPIAVGRPRLSEVKSGRAA